MKTKNKIIIYSIIFAIDLILFISELFIFEIDGTIGLLITLVSICIMIISIIKLYKLSSRFKGIVKSIINFFFNIE